LDEPTIGLDVVSQKKVREFLKEHNARRKTTIILTSHYMADIEALCDRVMIIDHGQLFFDGRLSEIVDQFANFKMLTLQTEAPLDQDTLAALEKHGSVEKISDLEVRVSAPRKKVIEVCKWALDHIPVQDIDIQEEPIEDVIGKLFTRPRTTETRSMDDPALESPQ
jgi:ABC-2 type transport system ATP-binding protein